MIARQMVHSWDRGRQSRGWQRRQVDIGFVKQFVDVNAYAGIVDIILIARDGLARPPIQQQDQCFESRVVPGGGKCLETNNGNGSVSDWQLILLMSGD